MKQKKSKIQLQDLQTNVNEYAVYDVFKHGIDCNQQVLSFKDILGNSFSVGKDSNNIVTYAIPEFFTNQYQPIILEFADNSKHITIVSIATVRKLIKFGMENALFSYSEKNYYYNDMLNIINEIEHPKTHNIIDDIVYNYMTVVNYPVVITRVVDDDKKYYKVEVPDLPRLCIYVDKKEDIDKELTDAKREWFTSRVKHKQKIPLPSDYNNKRY